MGGGWGEERISSAHHVSLPDRYKNLLDAMVAAERRRQ